MSRSPIKLNRRQLLAGAGAATTALAFPHVWIPSTAHAQTSGHGALRHLLYIQLRGGFRFTCAFNGEVAPRFNPYGLTGMRAPGTQWGVSALLERAGWLQGEEGQARARLGMKPVHLFSNEMAVLPCVDHEPLGPEADGDHATALQRFITGQAGGSTSFLSLLNWGLRQRMARAAAEGRFPLPAVSLGHEGMAAGSGPYAGSRPPVLEADSAGRLLATRRDTTTYGRVLGSDVLKVGNGSTQVVDGITNQELETMLGTDSTGRRAALALRLFHLGCPAAFFTQGDYDLHSGEGTRLPSAMEELNRLLSGLHAALKRMRHEDGTSYWDTTLVVLGSEFGRGSGERSFNPEGGSDHGTDLATRWMSMPLMGGLVTAAGKGGARLGETRAHDLVASGPVYSYRSVLKTMMDLLGADHSHAFPADAPIEGLFA
ncbi:DUF1501 domain-containing protein [Archangium sp.]|uniref:DUF1501 domain-containing protein n=1 Tax=Archangium sp. TaxID=1872627 RepID=UPI002D59DADD|nr:DUF1501 domain-containing protein [Archangium sp.]HYO55741.1 DUF1501 domain-containing protein [Archangium sp.]